MSVDVSAYGHVQKTDVWYIDPLKSRDKILTFAKLVWFLNPEYNYEQDFKKILCVVEWTECEKANGFECDCTRKDNNKLVHIRITGVTKEQVCKTFSFF